jgi:hypothetical protein
MYEANLNKMKDKIQKDHNIVQYETMILTIVDQKQLMFAFTGTFALTWKFNNLSHDMSYIETPSFNFHCVLGMQYLFSGRPLFFYKVCIFGLWDCYMSSINFLHRQMYRQMYRQCCPFYYIKLTMVYVLIIIHYTAHKFANQLTTRIYSTIKFTLKS